MAEIRLALLSDTPITEVLDRISGRAGELLRADASAVSLVDRGALSLRAASGRAADLPGKRVAAAGTLAALVASTGKPIRVASLAADGRFDRSHLPHVPSGPGLGAPVLCDGELCGALTLSREEGAEEFTDDDAAFLQGLADQASLALEIGRARRLNERLVLAEDRQRIARDLHDLVIQRLFAQALTLEGLRSVLRHEVSISDRLGEVVEDLDGTIREIRSVIFRLDAPPDAPGVRAELGRLVEHAALSLGHPPALEVRGPLDDVASEHVVGNLLAVTREALANVARHARARRVVVTVTVADGEVVLRVADDGVGMGTSPRRSGLRNIRRRAEDLGGTVVLVSPPEGGLELTWRVPAAP
jgi:signal transduction histidine kinase